MGRYLPFLQEYTPIYTWIPSSKVSTLTVGSGSTGADFLSRAQLSWGLLVAPGELWQPPCVCASDHTIAAWEHLWTWKVVSCRHLLGDVDFVWYSHNNWLGRQQMWQWEHRVQSLNIPFVGVLCTGETHACDLEAHLVPRQHLGSHWTKSPLKMRSAKTALHSYMCTTGQSIHV